MPYDVVNRRTLLLAQTIPSFLHVSAGNRSAAARFYRDSSIAKPWRLSKPYSTCRLRLRNPDLPESLIIGVINRWRVAWLFIDEYAGTYRSMTTRRDKEYDLHSSSSCVPRPGRLSHLSRSARDRTMAMEQMTYAIYDFTLRPSHIPLRVRIRSLRSGI